MASWFEEFRTRTHSFDMTLLSKQRSGSKTSRFARMFRSKSDETMKPKRDGSSPPSVSPAESNSPGAPRRRRLMRVVRDEESAGEEYENPYLIRHYTKQYWEKQMDEARALQHTSSVPYSTNSDHTILKKHSSAEAPVPEVVTDTTEPIPPEPSSPSTNKHACFLDEVEVMEFKADQKISKQVVSRHRERLLDINIKKASSQSPSPPPFKQIAQKERSNEFGLAKKLSTEDNEEESNSYSSDPEEERKKSSHSKIKKLFCRKHDVDGMCEEFKNVKLEVVVDKASVVQL